LAARIPAGFPVAGQLVSPTGAVLHLLGHPARGKACGVVQINHGLAEHATRYARLAAFLASRGFHVYAHDHRGHGGTTAPDAPPRSFGRHDGWRKVLADAGAVHDLIATRHPGLPVIVFGHSMGGLIALNLVLDRSPRLAGAAIWNANVEAGIAARAARAILTWERFRLGSDVPSRLLPKLTFQAWARAFPDRRTAFDWLSRDPVEVDRYIADPLCGWDASVALWQDIFRLIRRGAADRNFGSVRRDLALNLVGGERDPATDGGRAVEKLAYRMRRMGFSNLVSTVYPETRHETLNETNRQAVMSDLADWALAVAQRRPAP